MWYGDRKNDGYLRSERTLFQVYAPNDFSLSETLSKIDTDFLGALPYWQQHFDQWVFTHNSRDGLAPDVLARLLQLESLHAPVKLRSWGFEELKARVFGLKDDDVAALLGSAPTVPKLLNLGFADLQVVLESIAKQPPPTTPDLRPVPADKLEESRLSPSARKLLGDGRLKSDLVRRFFQHWPEPRYGDRIAAAFRQRYESLK